MITLSSERQLILKGTSIYIFLTQKTVRSDTIQLVDEVEGQVWSISTESLMKAQKTKSEISKLKSKKVGKFYKNQNEMVESFLTLNKLNTEPALEEDTGERKGDKRAKIAIYASFIVNVVLFGVKIYASISSLSISVIASALV
jgi:hypothetical protein